MVERRGSMRSACRKLPGPSFPTVITFIENCDLYRRIGTMSYTILGRAVKNEHIALGVFGTTFGTAYLATRGGSKKTSRPTTVQEAKESVPVHASSAEEEKFILNFIKEAEKADAGSGQ